MHTFRCLRRTDDKMLLQDDGNNKNKEIKEIKKLVHSSLVDQFFENTRLFVKNTSTCMCGVPVWLSSARVLKAKQKCH